MSKITFEEKRLKAVKLKLVLFPAKCCCCNDTVKLEKMWCVPRYGINKTTFLWRYCQKCMPTAQDVINEIDTDNIPFGIADVDDFICFKKKPFTVVQI